MNQVSPFPHKVIVLRYSQNINLTLRLIGKDLVSCVAKSVTILLWIVTIQALAFCGYKIEYYKFTIKNI